VIIARSLINDPAILVGDDPTGILFHENGPLFPRVPAYVFFDLIDSHSFLG